MLGQLGMNVVVHYHLSEEGAKQTIQNLSGKKFKHLVLQTDLKDVSAIKELLQKAEKQVGPVSVLFNNAAEFFPTSLFSTTEEEWANILALNLKAPFFVTIFSRKDENFRRRKIINILYVSAVRP